MYKKLFLFFAAFYFLLFALPTYAASSDLQYDPSLKQATSCTEIESVMKDYINSYRNVSRPMPMYDMAVSANAPAMDGKASSQSTAGVGGGAGDVSTTNVQKDGVDEPELVKNDGTYIYYLDQQQGIIRILNIDSNKEVSKIVLPKEYWNTQLLLNGKKLILVGSKAMPFVAYDRAIIARDQQVLIAIYDISNIANAKMVQSYLYDGSLQDARVVDNKLVLVASQYFNRGPVYKVINDAANISKRAPNTSDFSVKASDILPKRTVVAYKQVTVAGKPTLIARKNALPISCSQLLYQKPNAQKDNTNAGSQGLTSIISLPLDIANPVPTIKTIIGNSSQIHVSTKSIYLTTPTYIASQFTCPVGAKIMCPMWRGQGSYTTIYGFDLKDISYKYASLVQGNTYNQYSMDEDAKGIFRIVTSDWNSGKTSSNVYTLGTDGKVLGSLQNIAPGETFYGVRFIGDDLYLVTYQQVDPLFVISLANTAKPQILGQLKMPGYSTYLHPYGAKENGVQYLIGLGYDMKNLTGGGQQQGGLKIDLYKVDFNAKDPKGNVSVTQAWSKVLGDSNSQTEALYNPRMFVYNAAKKELVLPVVLASTSPGQQCYISYDSNGAEIAKQCYPVDQARTTFAGVKGWILSTNNISDEFSVDYTSMISNPYDATQSILTNPRLFSSLQARVGYKGNQYYFVGNQFAHFFTPTNQAGTYLKFGTGTVK